MSLNRSTALTALWSGAALKVPDWPTTCSMFWCTWAASTRPGVLPINLGSTSTRSIARPVLEVPCAFPGWVTTYASSRPPVLSHPSLRQTEVYALSIRARAVPSRAGVAPSRVRLLVSVAGSSLGSSKLKSPIHTPRRSGCLGSIGGMW